MAHMEDRRDRLHSVESAAEFLGGVAVSTLRGWLTQGKLTRVKVGRLTRVREHELVALIKPQAGARNAQL
jgi:excisionase family DNA binding protein